MKRQQVGDAWRLHRFSTEFYAFGDKRVGPVDKGGANGSRASSVCATSGIDQVHQGFGKIECGGGAGRD